MKKIFIIIILMLLFGAVVSQVSGCTGFTYDDENNVFACHNEDWHEFFNIRFFPAIDDEYGCMFIESRITWDDGSEHMYPFSGMNDQGLWYSLYETPYLLPVNSSYKPTYYDVYSFYKVAILEKCLFECSTVIEAVDIIDNYNLETWDNDQALIADSTGNSAIIEGDDIIYKEGDFQVATNFLQSHPELGGTTSDAFDRYNIAYSMLENMTGPSVEYFRDICDAVHVEGSWYWTCHSIICDLSNQIMYMYYSGGYVKQVIINLDEELQQGEHYVYLGTLFEPEGNQPPVKPEPPTGNESGLPGEEIQYTIKKTSDPDGDKISYLINWGDENESFWHFERNGIYRFSHSWGLKGTYEIRVKARDEYGAESEWSDPLVVSMPRGKSIDYNPWLLRMIQRFPILEFLI